MDDTYYTNAQFLDDIWDDYEDDFEEDSDEDSENTWNIMAEDSAMEGSLFGWEV
jgi:hypothetical protein